MAEQTVQQLASKRCVPCEGDVPRYSRQEAEEQLQHLHGWQLSHDGLRIGKGWETKDFMAAVEFIGRVAELAEAEGHHPDLHLERYRHLRVEIWTHAVGGLSENDFILAAKIDQLDVETQ